VALVAFVGAALAHVAAPKVELAQMPKDLILRDARHAWPEAGKNDYEVLHGGNVVGRIVKMTHAPADRPWVWNFNNGASRGYAESRETAMVELRKAWDAESGTAAK
jgi:hypothetical protein